MDFTLWAYQVTPGSDHNLYFTEHEADCRRAALEQRAEVKEGDPDDDEHITILKDLMRALVRRVEGAYTAYVFGKKA